MFGLFKKSFESEMAEYDKQARDIGKKYGCDDPMNFMINVMTDPARMKAYDRDMTAMLKGRIACCIKHKRDAERVKHEKSLATHRSMYG
jgi:hypothetical protein